MGPTKDAEVRHEQKWQWEEEWSEQNEIESWMFQSLKPGSLALWHGVWQA